MKMEKDADKGTEVKMNMGRIFLCLKLKF